MSEDMQSGGGGLDRLRWVVAAIDVKRFRFAAHGINYRNEHVTDWLVSCRNLPNDTAA